MKINRIAPEPTGSFMEFSDYQAACEFLSQMLEKHGDNLKRAYYVRGQLLPIPEFLPEAIQKMIPGEDSVKKLVMKDKMTVSQARGYINVLRLIFSLEGIEEWKAQLQSKYKLN